MENKKFFHELMKKGERWCYVVENYKQPTWCNYSQALNGKMGCWSLTDLSPDGLREKISHDFCKECECYIIDSIK